MKSFTKISLLLLFSIITTGYLSAQRYVNQEWSSIVGLPVNIHWSSSMIASSGHIITVGNTYTAGQNTNVLLTKYATDGTIIWQVEYDNPDNHEDYGIAICEDNSGNFYVAGTSFRTSSSSLDLTVLKFNSSGVNQWAYFFDGSASGDDIPAGIVSDGTDVYVTGGTESTSTESDYITIKVKNDGNEVWNNLYDHNSLDDIAVEIALDPNGEIIVSGGSADQANLYDMATVKYSPSGNLVETHRSNYNVGIDQPTCFDIDTSGNAIVGGYYVPTPGEMQISLISLNDTLGLNWSILHDPTAGEDQVVDLVTDDAGNIYVTGHIEESPSYFKCYTAKFNSSGNLLWERDYQSPEGGAFGKSIKLGTSGEIYVAGMNYDEGNDTNIITLMYKTDGKLITSKEYDAGGTELLSNLESDYWGNIYLHGTSSVNGNGYVTLKYSTFDRSKEAVTDTTNNLEYINNEIVIRFSPDLMDTNVVDDKGKTFGTLSEFVKQPAIDSLNELFENAYNFGRFNVVKGFQRFRTSDTISISRLGDTVSIPIFWATLVVQVPESMNEVQASQHIDTSISSIVHFAELNFVGHTASIPNDSLFTSGGFVGLHDTVGSSGFFADINMPEAWDQEVGNTGTRVGVYDTGINWSHPDLSTTGSGTFQDSKIIDGWSIGNNTHISNGNPDSTEHGTWVSGIIGGIRNNSTGVSGVAGGDMSVNNSGASLIVMQEDGPTNAQEISEWVTYGALWNPNATEPGYGMHIQNHSWSWHSDSKLIWEATNFCARNAVVFVAASGNDGNTSKDFPASYKDEWVLKTGASDITGKTAYFTNWDNNLDFIAPGTADLYDCISGIGNGYDTLNFAAINGTSFAAPHVSGVAALFQSYALYNNLNLFAPEDIEHIIQNTAQDIQGTGYLTGPDPKSGFGRIQADQALSLVKTPKYEVQHVDVQIPINATLIASNQFRYFQRGFGNVNAGYYFTDIYEVTITVNHNIGSKSLIDYWKRDGNSNLWGYAGTGDTIIPEPNINLVSCNSSSAVIKGYVYKLKISSNVYAWLPITNTGIAKVAYSLHLDDETVNGIETSRLSSAGSFSLYPNPSNNVQYIQIDSRDQDQNVDITLFDINGRQVKSVFSGQVNGVRVIQSDVSSLPQGIYVYQLRCGSELKYLKSSVLK